MSLPPAKCDIQSHRHIFSLLVFRFETDKLGWSFQEKNKDVRTNILAHQLKQVCLEYLLMSVYEAVGRS